jgi:hypothetical protein
VLWLSGSAAGESAAPSSQPALRVGVSDAPPFAIHNADGSWSGIAVDLWREIARALGRTFAFEQREPARLLQGLGDGSLDVVVGPVAVTPAHEALADFTHAYLSTNLSIAARPNAVPSWRRILSVVFAPRLVHVLVSLALVTVVLGALVWLLERRENPEHFERPACRGSRHLSVRIPSNSKTSRRSSTSLTSLRKSPTDTVTGPSVRGGSSRKGSADTEAGPRARAIDAHWIRPAHARMRIEDSCYEGPEVTENARYHLMDLRSSYHG